MNRYPAWKYALLAVALLVGIVYALPNFFGEAPAVQVSSGKVTLKLEPSLAGTVEQILAKAGLKPDFVQFDGNSVKARFADLDAQRKAEEAIAAALNPDASDPSYIVALNLLSRSPKWLTALHALPMYLGLDLRGGVHFLMQVDMKAALTRKADSVVGDVRTLLRDKNIRHAGISRDANTVTIRFRDHDTLVASQTLLQDRLADLDWRESADGTDWKLSGNFRPDSGTRMQNEAIKQNMVTLARRLASLPETARAEPVIQQQGQDRIIVELPGIQDTARAKDIIGRTATLEMRMADDSSEARAAETGSGPVPFGDERYTERRGSPIVVKRQIIITGENLTDAQPGFDENHQPAVHLTVDAKGARIMRDVSRENIGKRMAILLFEKGKGEVVTAPVIRGELGDRFQISGSMTTVEANDTALLLRAGSLAAPMEIIEERTIGPSLGAENIAKGMQSVMYGFAAIAVFMCVYYLSLIHI